MGRISALEHNGLMEGTPEHKEYIEYIYKIEDVIYRSVNTREFNKSRRRILIENLEKTKNLSFDIGKIDNLQLLCFLKSKKSEDKDLVLTILRKAQNEINPKDYGYGTFDFFDYMNL